MVDIEFKTLDQKAITCWTWGQVVGQFFVLASVAVGLYFVSIRKTLVPLEWSVLALAIVFVLSVLTILFYPKWRWKRLSYAINSDFIEIHFGVWFRESVVIPVKRIQHIILKEGPILRAYELADLSIYTAATTHTIPALLKSEAEMVRNDLARFAKLKLDETEHDA